MLGLSLVLAGAAIAFAVAYPRARGTPPPTATPTSSPTPTASPTVTPTPSPTPSSTPTVTPTPTPQPAGVQVPAVDPATLVVDATVADLLWLQEYDAAEDAIRKALATADPDEAAHLRVALARALVGQGRLEEALTLLDTLAADDTIPFPEVHLWRARILEGLGRPWDALRAYSHYLTLAPASPIAAYVHRETARLWREQGEHNLALGAYRQAIRLADARTRVAWRLELAAYLRDLGRTQDALAIYDEELARAASPVLRARIHAERGDTLLRAGETERAFAALRAAMAQAVQVSAADVTRPAQVNAGAIPYAYRALSRLVEAGVTVDDYTRGVIDVEAGAYEPAVSVLIRYLDGVTPHRGDAHAYLARALVALGRTDAAIAQWQALVNTHPECPCWGDAWFQLASLYRRTGQSARARTLMLRLAAREDVAASLRERARLVAAEILHALGQDARASTAYARLALEATSPDVRNRAALMAAVLSLDREPTTAVAVLEHALTFEVHPNWWYPMRYWLGKAYLRAGDREQARRTWQELAARRPLSHYAFRAAGQLRALGLSVPPWTPDPEPQGGIPQLEVATWPREAARTWAQALAYDRAGLTGQAAAAYTATVDALEDAGQLLALGDFLQARGYPHLGIRAASRALRVAGLSPQDAPLPYWRLLYPMPARAYVENLARAYDMDPALLFALIRQESHFNAIATSTASARGLMQLIPDTARYVARSLGLSLAQDDLYRPGINLRLGTYYLAYVLARFQGDVPAALAGYNAGPGNAAYWRKRFGADDDRFLERIPILETRTYLRGVQRMWRVYAVLLAEEE